MSEKTVITRVKQGILRLFGKETESPRYANMSYQQSFRTRHDLAADSRDGLFKSLKKRFLGRKNKPKDVIRKQQVSAKKKVCLATLLLAFSVVCYLVSGPVVNMAASLDYFKITKIEVSGCDKTTPAELKELGGVRYQQSLVDVDLEALTAKLKGHKWISDVVVTRAWPDELFIAVTEYTPQAIINLVDEGQKRFYYLDKKGVPFSPVFPGQDVDYPVITGLDEVKSASGHEEVLGEILAFLKLARRNNPNLPAQSISEIHVDAVEGLVIYLVEHPFPIYFGRGEVRGKYIKLWKVLENLYRRDKYGKQIEQIAYIRMDYQKNKVLVAQSGSG